MTFLLFRLIRPHGRLVLAAQAANGAGALFEGTTLAALTLALQVLGDGSSAPLGGGSLGLLGKWLTPWVQSLGKEALFLCLVLVAIGGQVLRSGLQFLSDVAAERLQARVQAEAYTRIYRRIMRLPFAKISAYRLGDLTDYLGQADHLREICNRFNNLARTLLMVAVYVGMLFCLSGRLTLLAIGAYGAMTLLFQKILTRVVRYANSHVKSTVELHERTTEFLQATRLIHTFSHQEQTIEAVSQLARDGIDSRRKASLWGGSVESITDILTVLGAGLLLIGRYLALHEQGGAALAQLLAFLLVLYRVTPRLRTVYESITALAEFKPNVARLTEILTQEEEPADTERAVFPGLKEKIEFQNVSLRYLPEEPPALIDLSWEVRRGSFTALVGASGTGKSTVMDLLLRLFDPTSGRILVDGVDLRSYRKSSWRDHLGAVAQDSFLFHASIRDNIALGRPEASLEEIQAAARAAHADVFIQRLSEGYDTVVGDRGYRLSGGQCQRVALARALIRNPSILILDEATSALDSESERLIQQALELQRGHRTIFAIAHRLSTVAPADQILVLAEGRLVEQGTHAQLLEKDGVYARLWKLQSEHRVHLDKKELVS